MKKMIVVFVVICLTLSACGSGKQAGATNKTETANTELTNKMDEEQGEKVVSAEEIVSDNSTTEIETAEDIETEKSESEEAEVKATETEEAAEEEAPKPKRSRKKKEA